MVLHSRRHHSKATVQPFIYYSNVGQMLTDEEDCMQCVAGGVTCESLWSCSVATRERTGCRTHKGEYSDELEEASLYEHDEIVLLLLEKGPGINLH
jgi:hypothetical protein